MDKAAFVYCGSELTNLPSNSVSLSMLIDWSEMRHMTSLSSGNAKALKAESGVTKWVAFCKVLSEMIFLMVEEDPTDWYKGDKKVASIKRAPPKLILKEATKVGPKVGPKVKVGLKGLPGKKVVDPKKNPFLETDSESDFEPFTQKTPPRPPKAKTVKRKPNVLPKLRKLESVRGGGGADFDLQMGLALSISEVEVRTIKHNIVVKKKNNANIYCLQTNKHV